LSDEPEWFAQRRYGFGAGRPISWQGWALVIGYVAVIAVSVRLIRSQTAFVLGVLIPATAVLFVIAARTTRGGWRWRWGPED
jgi:hypothetical protein